MATHSPCRAPSGLCWNTFGDLQHTPLSPSGLWVCRKAAPESCFLFLSETSARAVVGKGSPGSWVSTPNPTDAPNSPTTAPTQDSVIRTRLPTDPGTGCTHQARWYQCPGKYRHLGTDTTAGGGSPTAIVFRLHLPVTLVPVPGEVLPSTVAHAGGDSPTAQDVR